MRGEDERSGSLFSYVDLEARVGRGHPLRAIRAIVNEALAALAGEFSALYSPMGRPSIAPEKLLRAMLLQAFYSIRSERQVMERLEFDLLFRWFVGMGVDDAVWDHSVFSKNRDRLLEGDIAAKFMRAILEQPRVKRLLSTDHFSVDGTLIEAWASMKSFKPKSGRDEPPAEGGRAEPGSGFSRREALERHAEHERALLGDRQPHDAARQLRRQPTHPQTDRGSLRLDQDDRRARENQVPRAGARRMGLYLRGRRLQSGAAAQARGGADMSAPTMPVNFLADWIHAVEYISVRFVPRQAYATAIPARSAGDRGRKA
jgi:transposase